MNFLMRSNTQHVPSENIPPIQDTAIDSRKKSSKSTTLEGLIAQDPLRFSGSSEEPLSDSEGSGDENGHMTSASSKGDSPAFMENHIDVSDEEGWIIIPNGKLPENVSESPDINALRSLDRSFVFPGEQLQILACLSAHKPEAELMTPFKVAAVLSKNGNVSNEKRNGYVSKRGKSSPEALNNEIGNSNSGEDEMNSVLESESIIRMENHKKATATLLERFKNSHYFVRIAEEGEPLWSKKDQSVQRKNDLDCNPSTATGSSSKSSFKCDSNTQVSGATAKNSFSCYSLPNGDIMVILQMSVNVSSSKDPTIEILQFEKHEMRTLNSESMSSDPCGDLIKWILPIDNTMWSSSRSFSPPPMNPTSLNATPPRPTSGSQLLSHFRSYSMSSLPPNTTPPPTKSQSSKPNFDLEDWDQFSSSKSMKPQNAPTDGLLSFRGVTLERERFSVRCGLEGSYVPGRRWTKKLTIIQPLEIRSFSSSCNTNDFLCVQIQNISPAHEASVVVYVDAITIVFEDASKGSPPSSLPVACVEAGDGHSLPNLALSSGEEHSFILKPLCSNWKNSTKTPSLPIGKDVSHTERYSIVVSCRTNYSESRMFFKQQTCWRPRYSRDISISVTGESCETIGESSQLPVQIVTLQASNLTSEDLTMTVVAPASYSRASSVGSMSSPSSPSSPFVALSESFDKAAGDDPVCPDPKSPRCTHLWLQSCVPLGRVPPLSTASVKLDLLPLTNGIIMLDTLQISVKEKDLTYVPEHALQINATSSISTGIL